MEKFKKMVGIGTFGFTDKTIQDLHDTAEELVFYPEIPETQEEIAKLVGDADALLVRTEPKVTAECMDLCPNLKYVGMCCSLYSKESANVDIAYAEDHGIQVYGILDYGDNGVGEFVVWQLVSILHGYGVPMWKERPMELLDLKVGIVGMGTTGSLITERLLAFGADVRYHSRTIKPQWEERGIHMTLLKDLVRECDVIITCLHRNCIVLREEEMEALGNGKIMINISIGSAAKDELLLEWVKDPSNVFCGDSREALGELADELLKYPNVHTQNAFAGMTEQAYQLMGDKSVDNIKKALSNL